MQLGHWPFYLPQLQVHPWLATGPDIFLTQFQVHHQLATRLGLFLSQCTLLKFMTFFLIRVHLFYSWIFLENHEKLTNPWHHFNSPILIEIVKKLEVSKHFSNSWTSFILRIYFSSLWHFWNWWTFLNGWTLFKLPLFLFQILKKKSQTFFMFCGSGKLT